MNKYFIALMLILSINVLVKPVTIKNGVHKEFYAIAEYNNNVQKGMRVRPGETVKFEEIYVGMYDVSDRIVPNTIYFYWSAKEIQFLDYRLLRGFTNYLHKVKINDSCERFIVLGLGNILITQSLEI